MAAYQPKTITVLLMQPFICPQNGEDAARCKKAGIPQEFRAYKTKPELVQMQSQRYFVERSFQDAKQEIGMSQYQVRGWLAWHHLIALVMLSMEFVLTEKMLFKNEYPLLTSYDIREVFINLYAGKGATFDEVMDQMKHRHSQRNADIERNRGH